MNNGPTLPQVPPIPGVQMVTEKGYVTREWWRWFAQVAALFSMITNGEAPGSTALPFPVPPDALPSPSNIAALSEITAIPADTGLPPNQAALSGVIIAVPGDTVPRDQIAMQALMMSVPP